jgi:hypothetical protein
MKFYIFNTSVDQFWQKMAPLCVFKHFWSEILKSFPCFPVFDFLPIPVGHPHPRPRYSPNLHIHFLFLAENRMIEMLFFKSCTY